MKNIILKYFISFFTISFLLLLVAAPLFHDHAISLEEPVTCPVYIFQITVASILVFSTVVASAFIRSEAFFLPLNLTNDLRSALPSKIISRAPPIF